MATHLSSPETSCFRGFGPPALHTAGFLNPIRPSFGGTLDVEGTRDGATWSLGAESLQSEARSSTCARGRPIAQIWPHRSVGGWSSKDFDWLQRAV